jgi:hypothetical protein
MRGASHRGGKVRFCVSTGDTGDGDALQPSARTRRTIRDTELSGRNPLGPNHRDLGTRDVAAPNPLGTSPPAAWCPVRHSVSCLAICGSPAGCLVPTPPASSRIMRASRMHRTSSAVMLRRDVKIRRSYHHLGLLHDSERLARLHNGKRIKRKHTGQLRQAAPVLYTSGVATESAKLSLYSAYYLIVR